MKPGSRDRQYSVRIQGAELDLFKDICLDLPESFGLDARIQKYNGTRPIGFWSWDLDCLEAVFADERETRLENDAVFASLNAKITALIAEVGRDRE
jgi:hypothetical protein